MEQRTINWIISGVIAVALAGLLLFINRGWAQPTPAVTPLTPEPWPTTPPTFTPLPPTVPPAAPTSSPT